jgi:CheY-like chemotaxis protein
MEARPIAVVVDDSKHFRLYLTDILSRLNFEVLPVDNATDALEICRMTRPHIVTMDIVMPGMDGLEALRAIRDDEELADLPVIMISSYRDKNRQWQALSLGCIDILDKPVDLHRLHKTIQRCDLYPGARRRYLRAPFEKKVVLHFQGTRYEVPVATLSERGIFVHLEEQLPKGAHVDIDLPVSSDETMQVGGPVIHCRTQQDGGAVSYGVAIKFSRLTAKELEIISGLVEKLLIGDALEEQA